MIGGMAFVGVSTEIGCDWKRAKWGCESGADEWNLNKCNQGEGGRFLSWFNDLHAGFLHPKLVGHCPMIAKSPAKIQESSLKWCVVVIFKHWGAENGPTHCEYRGTKLFCLGNHWKSRLSSQRYHKETCSVCYDLELCNQLARWAFCRGPSLLSRWMYDFREGFQTSYLTDCEAWHPDIVRPSLSWV